VRAGNLPVILLPALGAPVSGVLIARRRPV
jgi:hypothetical protein